MQKLFLFSYFLIAMAFLFAQEDKGQNKHKKILDIEITFRDERRATNSFQRRGPNREGGRKEDRPFRERRAPREDGGERPSREDRPFRERRGPREDGGERPFRERRGPREDGEERSPREDRPFQRRGPREDGEERSPREDRQFQPREDRPPRDFADRSKRGGASSGPRKSGGKLSAPKIDNLDDFPTL